MAFISRSFKRKYLRPKPLILLLAIVLLLDALFIIESLPLSHRVSPGNSVLKPEKIFIASMFRNSEYILRLSYINSLITLVTYLGPENVFVSISESGSLENTKGAIEDLRLELENLGVKHHITTGIDHIQQLEMLRTLPPEGQRDGWAYTGRPDHVSGKDGWELRRIPYLAKQRNMVMEPLRESKTRQWDKVLWINDVVFTTEDVTTLLSTNSGSYAAACSLDFASSPTSYYDTFALRDALGHKAVSQSWPYFLSKTSLSALRSNRPVPVASCWNGMIVFDAAPFYSPSLGGSSLQFRGVDDELAAHHVEGSECCLIHADNPESQEKGVFLNPNVRVSYNATVYPIVNPGIHELQWPARSDMVKGMWRNRMSRWAGWVKLWSEGTVVRRRVGKWIKEGKKVGEAREERGLECLVNEMQVLYDNGWQHV